MLGGTFVHSRARGIASWSADCHKVPKPDPTGLQVGPLRCRAEVVALFFSRLADRRAALTHVLRALDRETAVLVCHRLGYCNVFSAARPSMYYRLRMWRADDRAIAQRLIRVSDWSDANCFKHVAVNGAERKIIKGPGA
jgi:hypothetical protein